MGSPSVTHLGIPAVPALNSRCPPVDSPPLILCSVHDVQPGDVVGGVIVHPGSPALQLLKPGVVLDACMIAGVIRMGVSQVWIEDDATRDVDGAVIEQLSAARVEMFTRFKEDLRAVSQHTVAAEQVQNCRQSVNTLVCELIANGKYASLADPLFGTDDLVGHATNVAYLSILIGLEVQAYIVKERPRLNAAHARDMGGLGLAGMLHDVGKSRLERGAARTHEVHKAMPETGAGDYDRHTLDGYRMLRQSRGAASVTQAALNHHQRFDGTGWPDMAAATGNRRSGAQSGRQIHIFTRIVAAANVLDNLMRSATGERLPPVAALHAFASSRFDGWFDPIVRRAALRRIPPFAVGSQVGLSDGRKAVVLAPCMNNPCRPLVRPLGKTEPAKAALDLEQNPGLCITHYLGQDVKQWLYTVPSHAAARDAAAAMLQGAVEHAGATRQAA